MITFLVSFEESNTHIKANIIINTMPLISQDINDLMNTNDTIQLMTIRTNIMFKYKVPKTE